GPRFRFETAISRARLRYSLDLLAGCAAKEAAPEIYIFVCPLSIQFEQLLRACRPGLCEIAEGAPEICGVDRRFAQPFAHARQNRRPEGLSLQRDFAELGRCIDSVLRGIAQEFWKRFGLARACAAGLLRGHASSSPSSGKSHCATIR